MTVKQADEWLQRIERSGLPGKFKTWLFQHGLLPRLLWLLTIYELTMTAVEGIERKVNKHLRKWLGIPPSFTSVGLYIRSGQLQLPLSLVVAEFKVAKCRAVMMLKDSTDEMVRGAGATTSGRKMGSRQTNTTGRKYAEVEGRHRKPVHGVARTRVHPFPGVDEG